MKRHIKTPSGAEIIVRTAPKKLGSGVIIKIKIEDKTIETYLDLTTLESLHETLLAFSLFQ